MVSPYVYSTLRGQPRHFRALKLLPPLPSRIPGLSSTIRVELVNVDVDAGVPFDALSYTWGVSEHDAPDRRVLVEANNKTFELKIFRPLETGLLHLCANGMTHRPLFVDQICINQEDKDEKNALIPLMRDIYTKATRVVAWLGPGTAVSDKYFDSLIDVCREGILSRLMGPHQPHFMQVFDAVMDSRIEVDGIVRQDKEDVMFLVEKYRATFPVKGLKDALERVWANRLWIIQEVCLGGSVLFVCGTKSACFDCFRAGLLFFNIVTTYMVTNDTAAHSKEDLRDRAHVQDLAVSLIRIQQQRRSIHTLDNRQSLYDLVTKFNVNDGKAKIGATRPEDRIFALMGLAARASANTIPVRYDEAANVYMDLVKAFITGNIDVLLFSQFPKLLPNLPSWTPDWSMDLRVPYGYTDLTQPLFKAGNVESLGAESQIDTAAGCLTTKGVIVDRIIRVGQYSVEKDAERHVMEEIDYRLTASFLDEIPEFLQLAREIPGTRLPQVPNTDAWTDAIIRISDGGVSAKYFLGTFGIDKGRAQLEAAYQQLIKWGQWLVKHHENIQTFHITRILSRVTEFPWYWCPASEFELFQNMAVDPVATYKSGIDGAMSFFTDLLSLCIASAKVVTYGKYIKFRRRVTDRVQLKNPGREQVLERVGLDPNVGTGRDFSTYSLGLQKNLGRRLCLTETGYVGLGPAEMAVGDNIVILFGGTVPHVLRPVETSSPIDGGSGWSYIGECYCDGVMEGEFMKQTDVADESVAFHIY